MSKKIILASLFSLASVNAYSAFQVEPEDRMTPAIEVASKASSAGVSQIGAGIPHANYGGGKGIELNKAVEMIMPEGFSFQPDINVNTSKVSWGGEKTWLHVLETFANQNNIHFIVDWKQKKLFAQNIDGTVGSTISGISLKSNDYKKQVTAKCSNVIPALTQSVEIIDGYALDTTTKKTLDFLSTSLMQSPNETVEINGYSGRPVVSDADQAEWYARLQMISDYLQLKGVSKERIKVGEVSPMMDQGRPSIKIDTFNSCMPGKPMVDNSVAGINGVQYDNPESIYSVIYGGKQTNSLEQALVKILPRGWKYRVHDEMLRKTVSWSGGFTSAEIVKDLAIHLGLGVQFDEKNEILTMY